METLIQDAETRVNSIGKDGGLCNIVEEMTLQSSGKWTSDQHEGESTRATERRNSETHIVAAA